MFCDRIHNCIHSLWKFLWKPGVRRPFGLSLADGHTRLTCGRRAGHGRATGTVLRWRHTVTIHFFSLLSLPFTFPQFGPTWSLGRCQCSPGIRSSLSWSPANRERPPSLPTANSLSIRAKVATDSFSLDVTSRHMEE